MKKVEFPISTELEKDYVEAEIVGERERIHSEEKSFFGRILAKLGKATFFIFFALAFLLIVLGSLLCATVIGILVGAPLILLGLIFLFIGVKIYFSLSLRNNY